MGPSLDLHLLQPRRLDCEAISGPNRAVKDMTAGGWDERHQHNFQALLCLRPEADFALASDISQAVIAYVNADRPQVSR